MNLKNNLFVHSFDMLYSYLNASFTRLFLFSLTQTKKVDRRFIIILDVCLFKNFG